MVGFSLTYSDQTGNTFSRIESGGGNEITASDGKASRFSDLAGNQGGVDRIIRRDDPLLATIISDLWDNSAAAAVDGRNSELNDDYRTEVGVEFVYESNHLNKRWSPNWFSNNVSNNLDLIAYKELREDSNDVKYHDLYYTNFALNSATITITAHGYKDVIPVYFRTDNYGNNPTESPLFFKNNNISYKTLYYLKPTGSDTFTIHTSYPNNNNAVIFSYIPLQDTTPNDSSDNSFIGIVLINKIYKHDKFDNTYNEKSKLTSNKTFTLNFDVNASDRLLSNIPPDIPPLIRSEGNSATIINGVYTTSSSANTNIATPSNVEDAITVAFWIQIPEIIVSSNNSDYLMNSNMSPNDYKYIFSFHNNLNIASYHLFWNNSINNNLWWKIGDPATQRYIYSVGNLRNKWIHIAFSIYKEGNNFYTYSFFNGKKSTTVDITSYITSGVTNFREEFNSFRFDQRTNSPNTPNTINFRVYDFFMFNKKMDESEIALVKDYGRRIYAAPSLNRNNSEYYTSNKIDYIRKSNYDTNGWTFSFRFKLSDGQLDTTGKSIGIIQLTHTETTETMWDNESLREISFGISYKNLGGTLGYKYVFNLAGAIELKIKDGDYPDITD